MTGPRRRSAASRREGRSIKLSLLAVWMAAVMIQSAQHVFSRDEVRALSFALKGPLPFGFLPTLQGEGHPAVWYFLLRGAYVVLGRPQALPAVAFLVAFAAMLLFVVRAPFRWPMIALVLFSHFALFEYSVMARNYGLSALALFGFAALYNRRRNQGFILGGILFFLANCNVPSVLLAGGLLIAWGGDVISKNGLRWSRPFRVFLQNGVLAALGVVVCFLTIYPNFNDPNARDLTTFSPVAAALKAVFIPASEMSDISSGILLNFIHLHGHLAFVAKVVVDVLMSGLMFTAALGLLRYPGALAAALFSLVSLSVYFALGVEGAYRHEALWLVFLTTLYWITDVADPPVEKWRPAGAAAFRTIAQQVGRIAFISLLALQLVPASADVLHIKNPAPLSRSRELARLLATRPDLRDAVVIAEPDYLVESLPFYLSNQTYLLREHRYGDVVRFSQIRRLDVSLQEVLQTARRLQSETHRPILILLQQRLNEIPIAGGPKPGHDWTMTTTPAQIAEFEASTERLARFDPVLTADNYDVYQLH